LKDGYIIHIVEIMLEDKHRVALDKALIWINENFNPISIVVGGSIIRKKFEKGSDLDIYVIHNENFRQRFFKYFNDVPCDIFINNKAHIKKYFAEEHNKNRPTTANLLDTGEIIYGKKEINDILELAKKLAHSPKKLNNFQIKQSQYYILTLIEDAEDIIEKDSTCCSYILDLVIHEIINYYYIINYKVLPRIKDRIVELEDIKLRNNLTKFYNTSNNIEKLNIIQLIILNLNINNGNNEWESEKE